MNKKPTTPTKGELRIQKILEVATNMLVKKGFAGLSIRNIASKANMQPGNLQYYFASKQDIITAILELEFQRYQTTLENRFNDNAYTGEQQLKFSIKYFLKDQQKQRSCVIYWELWALAAHEPDVAQIMDTFYQIYLDKVSHLIQNINPELTPQKATKISTLIISMIEGLSLFRGYNKPERPHLQGIEDELQSAIIKLIL